MILDGKRRRPALLLAVVLLSACGADQPPTYVGAPSAPPPDATATPAQPVATPTAGAPTPQPTATPTPTPNSTMPVPVATPTPAASPSPTPGQTADPASEARAEFEQLQVLERACCDNAP